MEIRLPGGRREANMRQRAAGPIMGDPDQPEACVVRALLRAMKSEPQVESMASQEQGGRGRIIGVRPFLRSFHSMAPCLLRLGAQ